MSLCYYVTSSRIGSDGVKSCIVEAYNVTFSPVRFDGVEARQDLSNRVAVL